MITVATVRFMTAYQHHKWQWSMSNAIRLGKNQGREKKNGITKQRQKGIFLELN